MLIVNNIENAKKDDIEFSFHWKIRISAHVIIAESFLNYVENVKIGRLWNAIAKHRKWSLPVEEKPMHLFALE